MKTTTLILLIALATLAGCSDDSAPTTAPVATLDTAPPAVPTGLNAAAGRSAVKLSWQPNVTDSDCVGFHVYRIAFGETWPRTDEPVAATQWLDTEPLLGPAVYAVTAIDAAGNESAWTQIRFDYADEQPQMTR